MSLEQLFFEIQIKTLIYYTWLIIYTVAIWFTTYRILSFLFPNNLINNSIWNSTELKSKSNNVGIKEWMDEIKRKEWVDELRRIFDNLPAFIIIFMIVLFIILLWKEII